MSASSWSCQTRPSPSYILAPPSLEPTASSGRRSFQMLTVPRSLLLPSRRRPPRPAAQFWDSLLLPSTCDSAQVVHVGRPTTAGAAHLEPIRCRLTEEPHG